jgi:hypothetical protein
MAKVEITNKLLKEAIADAETLVATAVENAKISLEETFTPQIKSMLSRRLRAEAEGMDDEKETEADVEAPEAEKKEAPAAAKAPAHAAPKMETAKELPFQDGEPVGSSEMPADTSAIGAGDNKEPSADAFDSADDDMSGEDAGQSETDWYDDWSDSDFDLDEIIAELENDVMAHAHKGEEEEETADEAYPDENPEGGKLKPEIPADSSDIGKAEGADQVSNPQHFALNPMEPKMEDDKMNAPAPAAPPEGEQPEDGELDLEQLMRELQDEEEQRRQQNIAASQKMAALEKKLAEYRMAVETLRGSLKEVNLLNAKLLYTNRIFRKEGLTNEQKVMVVENFDRATTVREVKMVYTVLVETLTSAAKVVKATKPTKKIVAEGLASKATPSTAPKTPTPEQIAENSVARRLQQLAGIIS